MRLLFSFVLATLAVLTVAEAASNLTDSTDNGTLVPLEAVIGGLPIPDDVFPVFNYENNTATVVFLNATILAEAKAHSAENLTKRDAEASAEPWHWGRLRMGQPMYKREAEAEAEADANRFRWAYRKPIKFIFWE
ncbi:hypothetical protein OXX80_009099 [Metschnikowia pulcherrima]